MYVVGTAGHVDHGKSTLVKVLTGIDPDRWAEEQRREMTIDLGFAWLTLPSGRNVSMVDVPGHERFIKNMLAGVGGIDAALLIIAADESLMPQTEEHLAILDLLGVERGLIVLTKADLVDADWLELVAEEVAQRVAGTTMAHASRVAVSARTGQGIPELLRALDELLDTTPSRATAHGMPRLPIDRAFTIGGFGTVVTGTLADGPLEVGQEVEIQPSGLRARVRGLQTHKRHEERALSGSRVAVNLAGVHHKELARGDVLALPGALQPTDRIDIHLRLVPDAPRPLEQNAPLDVFVGAAETACYATLLDSDSIEPGASGWVQLRLARPIAVARGDRCIVRQASPSLTIGGGKVIDAHPPRHRRFRADVVGGLARLESGTPQDLILQALADGSPLEWSALLKASRLSEAVAREGLTPLVEAGTIVVLGAPPIVGDTATSVVVQTAEAWQGLASKLSESVRGYHRRYPLRRGIQREELRQRLRLGGRVADAAVAQAVAQGAVQANETTVWLRDFEPMPDATQRRAVDAFLAACGRSPYSPPTPDLDAEVMNWLLEQGLIVRVSPDVAFLSATYNELVVWVQTTIRVESSVTVGQLRDRFGTSRKYGLALLEHLDERKITRREGEGRVLY